MVCDFIKCVFSIILESTLDRPDLPVKYRISHYSLDLPESDIDQEIERAFGVCSFWGM